MISRKAIWSYIQLIKMEEEQSQIIIRKGIFIRFTKAFQNWKNIHVFISLELKQGMK